MKLRHILRFWLPLALSWLFMLSEGPIIAAVIQRLPNEVVMMAAQGIIIGMAVMIESPIINLLATSTALVRDRQSYEMMRRFTFHWVIGLTIISILLAFTPLFDIVIVGAMGVPPQVAIWARVGLQILFLWSGAIAWRRFLQGVFIFFGKTNLVAWGTVVRLSTGALTAFGLAYFTDFPGAVIGASTLLSAVLSEAVFATFIARPLVKAHFYSDSSDPSPSNTPSISRKPLTYQALFKFHLPLALTAVLTLMVHPMVNFVLARMENPVVSLAAWPLLFQITLLTRAGSFASQETIISLNKDKNGRALRRFVGLLTVGGFVVMALLLFTPFLNYYVVVVQNTSEIVATQVKAGTLLLLFYPAVTALTQGARGFLISARHTSAVNIGMGINFIVMALILFVGFNRFAAIPMAAMALNISLLAETIYLLWEARRRGLLTL